MNWKFEKVDDGYKLYYEAMYPLPDHSYAVWWPVLNPFKGANNYLFESLEEAHKRVKLGSIPVLELAKKKYLEVNNEQS